MQGNFKYLNWLALGTAIGIAGIIAWFSVLGLATMFSGAWLSVVIMAGSLEIGKLVTADLSTLAVGQIKLHEVLLD